MPGLRLRGMTMHVDLLPLSPDAPFFAEAVGVYSAYTGVRHDAAERFFAGYATYPDYFGYAACAGERVVGVTFGTRSLPGHWWHDRVGEQVGARHLALQEAWVLTELHVLDGFRNRRIGALLHDRVIGAQPYRNLLLSTPVSNTDAQRFYLRHGWRVLHAGFPFIYGDQPFMILCLRLG